MVSDTPLDLLLVEDNPGDVRLVEEAVSAWDEETRIHSVSNGDDAIEFLTRQRTVEDGQLPNLVLIDLNLPGKSGREVLEAIRADARLRRLPAIVLSSSDDREDVVSCYDAGANAYLTKPTDPDEIVSLMETVEQFWCKRVQLPPTSP